MPFIEHIDDETRRPKTIFRRTDSPGVRDGAKRQNDQSPARRKTNDTAGPGSAPELAGPTLPGPARWLGAKDGYSAEDLTSLQLAYECFEVSRPDPTIRENEVLELRIHGVGGASAETNLETPTTLMVAGDKKAGFYRAWFPGQNSARTPLREAYCWGRFSFAALTSALWLLLLPFALVNLASWALPSPCRESGDWKQEDWRRVRQLSGVLLRLLGLVFTAAFVTTICFLLVDIGARQAATDGRLPGWLGWYERMPAAHREALALGVVVLAVAALRVFSKVTTGRYEGWSPGNHLPELPPMRLSARGMWAGSTSVRRQQLCHVLGSCALILTFAGLAFGPESWQMRVGTIVAIVMGAFAAAVLATPGCDRLWVNARQWALPDGVLTFLESLTWLGTVAAVAYVWIAEPTARGRGYDVEDMLLHGPVVAEFCLLFVLLGVVLMQRPWRQADVFAFGLLSVLLAGLAVGVSSIFGGALLLTVTNLLSTPSLTQEANKANIFVPGVVASGSLAFLATLAAALCVAVALYLWRRNLKKKLVHRGAGTAGSAPGQWVPSDIPVAQEYGLGTDRPGYDGAVTKVAGIWATSRMTDLAAATGAGLALPTLAVLLAAEAFALSGKQSDHLLDAAQIGSTLTAAATIAFIGFLRGALVSEAQRRKFAFFWDVVNFWPRAAHPFAPPCYAERVVPEVTTRIRRIIGDEERYDEENGVTDPAVGQVETERDPDSLDHGFEPHRPVVLNGYSQGSPISVAVMAQLPGDSHEKVALLTLACPAHRLYGRAFPLYFGPDQLEMLLEEKLTGPRKIVRWINMCRRSDYVGGPVGMDLDRWILDPPALWPASNPSPPPAHLHSDWFPDPKTHPPVRELADLLPRLPDPAAGS